MSLISGDFFLFFGWAFGYNFKSLLPYLLFWYDEKVLEKIIDACWDMLKKTICLETRVERALKHIESTQWLLTFSTTTTTTTTTTTQMSCF
jgi:hypothetical protein